MPAFYAATIPEFLTHEEDLIVGRQTNVTRTALTELSAGQLEAWREQLPILRAALTSDSARDWYLLLEYPIPRRGKRIDAVILAHDIILVLEFKCGGRKYDSEARTQVEDYCLDLRDFHAESRRRILIPFLIATNAESEPPAVGEVLDWVAPVWLANASSLPCLLERAVAQSSDYTAAPIDPQRWNGAEYAPTPTIIEAARVLYEGQNVHEISRCHAGAKNLTRTSAAVMRAIQSVRSSGSKTVSDFVSHLLAIRVADARAALASCPDFPLALTRDIENARAWLRRRQRGSRRIGLVASSGGRRLRADGLDVRTELDVENWFLNPASDVRASYYLETPATEFGIQGLELDWTGVCWDIDLVPERDGWSVGAFKGTRWQRVRDLTRYQYVLNKYRVLLTRAREGMIIWVPPGDQSDWTRPPWKYERIAEYLQSCGIKVI
jgi:hypothetical protein